MSVFKNLQVFWNWNWNWIGSSFLWEGLNFYFLCTLSVWFSGACCFFLFIQQLNTFEPDAWIRLVPTWVFFYLYMAVRPLLVLLKRDIKQHHHQQQQLNGAMVGWLSEHALVCAIRHKSFLVKQKKTSIATSFFSLFVALKFQDFV